jgi:hypothetical protein
MATIWILEQRRIGEQDWEPCFDTVPRKSKGEFSQGLFTKESFSRYEFRAFPYTRAVQPPPNTNAPGPMEPPRPLRDRAVSEKGIHDGQR